MTSKIDYAHVDYSRWSPLQRWIQRVVQILVRLLARVHVEGLEHIPRTGPFILAINHLSLLDAPVMFSFLPRRAVVFAADKWQRVPGINWALSAVGTAIYVARGQPDRRALRQALTVLRSGGILAMAPEGTRSRTGGLIQGHEGVAYLATRAPAPILPAVAYGQEKALHCWKRLRRPAIHVRFGALMELPPGRHSMEQLHLYTEQLMVTLARMLPPSYRGVYADQVAEPEEA